MSEQSKGTTQRAVIVAVLVVAVIGAVVYKKTTTQQPASETEEAALVANNTSSVQTLDQASQIAEAPKTAPTARMPRLVDLGASKCIPCKMMKPILEDFEKNYSSCFKTEFIDVWKNPKAGKEHGIRMIPTQIFYDSDGNELFRHEGFYSKEDMLKKWKELGVPCSE